MSIAPPSLEGKLPRIIWQTYRSAALPAEAAAASRTWRVLNPGWEHRFHDDAAAAAFVEREFPSLAAVYHALPLGVMKADLWRYAALYRHGGVYADIDAICRVPIEGWKVDDTCLTLALENEVHFCQWTMAAPPAHPVLAAVLRLIAERATRGYDLGYEHFVHEGTGPGVWTDAIREVLGLAGLPPERIRKDYPDVVRAAGLSILPAGTFGSGLVGHEYGSRHYGDGYASWTLERDRLNARQGGLLRRLTARLLSVR